MGERNSAQIELRNTNRAQIYQLFLTNDSLTRQGVVYKLKLSLPTVTKNFEELESEGLIKVTGSYGNMVGRKAMTYSVVRDAKVALGVDVTKNHVTVVVVDLLGNLMALERHRLSFAPEDIFFRTVGEYIAKIVSDCRLQPSQILGVGIGIPALVDRNRQNVFFSRIIDFSKSSIENFAEYIPYPIQLFNDANAAAFTETWSKRISSNMFYLMLSNNVGGSAVINNQVYTGDTQKSGEIGHVTLIPGGRQCYCGKYGCVDAYLSATNLSDYTEGNLALFFEKMEEGDLELADILEEYLENLSTTADTLHVLFDCPIVIGGYVGEYLEPYLEKLREKAASKNIFEDNADYLELCTYRKESIAAGAAMNLLSDYIAGI